MKGGADLNRNNLDLIRLFLATIVAFYHLSVLTGFPEYSTFGRYLSAHFAVKGFFVISGLLIYRSYITSSSNRSYLGKRVRRIYPAYFTVVLFAAIALFPLSTMTASQYFGAGFWKYIAANLVFLNFLEPSLPGVFTANTMSAVNGALWTLKIEVAFYLFVPVIHYLCNRFGTKKVIGAIFGLSCIWKYGFALLDLMYKSSGIYSLDSSRTLYSQLGSQFPAQLAYFSAGIFLYLYFDTLKQNMISILCVSAGLFSLDHWFTGELLDIVWISGFVFIVGFWIYLGNYSKYGDFSYGVYIVHFPILQVMIVFGRSILTPSVFLSLYVSLVGLAAFILWHLVEKRFLASSSHYCLISHKHSV